MIETDRDFNHLEQHAKYIQDDDGDDIWLYRNDPRNIEADSRNLSRRIPQAELHRVLVDTHSVLRTPLAETRSKKNAT